MVVCAVAPPNVVTVDGMGLRSLYAQKSPMNEAAPPVLLSSKYGIHCTGGWKAAGGKARSDVAAALPLGARAAAGAAVRPQCGYRRGGELSLNTHLFPRGVYTIGFVALPLGPRPAAGAAVRPQRGYRRGGEFSWSLRLRPLLRLD